MHISENSRIWIYQTNRLLKPEEEQRIQQRLNEFTSEWKAHGNSLAALGEIRHGQFIILSVDEQIAGATGCSIDRSVHLMREIEDEFGIELFDRFRIAYRNGDRIINCSRTEFEDLLSNGKLNQETIVFNNMVSIRKELETSWEVPVKRSWHATVFAGHLSTSS
jgi:hypothetical protein